MQKLIVFALVLVCLQAIKVETNQDHDSAYIACQRSNECGKEYQACTLDSGCRGAYRKCQKPGTAINKEEFAEVHKCLKEHPEEKSTAWAECVDAKCH